MHQNITRTLELVYLLQRHVPVFFRIPHFGDMPLAWHQNQMIHPLIEAQPKWPYPQPIGLLLQRQWFESCRRSPHQINSEVGSAGEVQLLKKESCSSSQTCFAP